MSCQISEKCFECEDVDRCDEHRKWPQCNEWERIKKHWQEEHKDGN